MKTYYPLAFLYNTHTEIKIERNKQYKNEGTETLTMDTIDEQEIGEEIYRIDRDADIRVERNSAGKEMIIFDPYNPLNQLITKEDVEGILRTYGIQIPIFNIELYKRAFIHQSYVRRPTLENTQNNIIFTERPSNCLPLYTKSNERLEFVGDGVLECITKYYLYKRFPKASESFLTSKKIELVKNYTIGRIAHEIGMHRWFVMSKHSERFRNNFEVLGCIFEAFVGAIFFDFNRIQVHDEYGWFDNHFMSGPGVQMAELFIQAVFEKHVDWTQLINTDNNFKNILQEMIQKEYQVTPEYCVMSDSHKKGKHHMGVYLCKGQNIHQALSRPQDCIVCSERFKSHEEIHDYLSKNQKIFLFLAEGKHKIKKNAEQIACEAAIQLLRKY
jgi:dsRNA-specific ribonuclease